MSSHLPSQLMSAAASRRKPRVCTREACETCREKKSKCDGEQPCSRCEARGLECHYQVRNHRSKRSLRNELNALKEKQRLQETLLAALQDPQRREAALRLLDSEDPMAGVEALFLKDELDTQRRRGDVDILDDGAPSTSGSPSPSPRHAVVQDFGASPRTGHMSPLRSNSVVSSIARSDSFPMAPMADAYTDHMNPFAGMSSNSPIYNQFASPFGAPAKVMPGGPYSGPGASANIFAPAWLDPTLNVGPGGPGGGQIPDWADGGGGGGVMGDSFRNSVGGANNPAGIPIMAQGGGGDPHQLPQTSNLSQLGQWDQQHPQQHHTGPINTTSNRRLSGSHDSASSVPSANSVPSLVSSGASSLPSRASFTAPPPPSGAVKVQPPPTTARRQRASVSSATSTHSQPRSQSRERHRLASARNWHKQKQATVDLQATKMRVEAQHAALREEYNEVLNQVQQIKHALLGHAACNDPAIKMWLKHEADGVMTGLQHPGATDGGDGRPNCPVPPHFEDGVVAGPGPAPADDAVMRGVEVNVRA